MLTFHWSGYHQKREPTESAEHKKMLFSLNTFLQEVILGKEDKVQLQNFILRAHGQIMLYVDGMQGVMQHIQVSNWSRWIT